jgi:hypothetical protein
MFQKTHGRKIHTETFVLLSFALVAQGKFIPLSDFHPLPRRILHVTSVLEYESRLLQKIRWPSQPRSQMNVPDTYLRIGKRAILVEMRHGGTPSCISL